MTPEQIALVEQSLTDLAADFDQVAADFYERLFSAAPETMELFSRDPIEQRRLFAAELRTIGFSIREFEAFKHEVRALGVRHRGYGVRAAHYRTAGPHLLAALAAASGDAWTPAVAEAWRLAYNLVAETMMEAAAGAP